MALRLPSAPRAAPRRRARTARRAISEPSHESLDARAEEVTRLRQEARDAVERIGVETSYRRSPRDAARWEPEGECGAGRTAVLFLSQGDVARGVLALAYFREEVLARGLDVDAASAATRDYCVGQPPHPAVLEAAERLCVELPAGHAAKMWTSEVDCADYDLLVTFDKDTLDDVLREVTIYDRIEQRKDAYSLRVRRLGEYHPGDMLEVADPLYGGWDGWDGEDTADKCVKAAVVIRAGVMGLADRLEVLQKQAKATGFTLRQALRADLQARGETPWDKPPMLSGGLVKADQLVESVFADAKDAAEAARREREEKTAGRS